MAHLLIFQLWKKCRIKYAPNGCEYQFLLCRVYFLSYYCLLIKRINKRQWETTRWDTGLIRKTSVFGFHFINIYLPSTAWFNDKIIIQSNWCTQRTQQANIGWARIKVGSQSCWNHREHIIESIKYRLAFGMIVIIKIVYFKLIFELCAKRVDGEFCLGII